MVINVGRLKAGDYEYVENDVIQVAQNAKNRGALVKVIIEAALLTDEEKVLVKQEYDKKISSPK